MNNFFNILFDSDQVTCFSPDTRGTAVAQFPDGEDLFFSINALHPTKDLNPTKEYHRPGLPRRADANVVCFRNFLIEIDSMPLSDQVEYVTSRIPVSTIVWSGGKSYHFIVSLEEPLKDYGEYMRVSRALSTMLPEADSTTKNPSRLSRIPGAIRKPKGAEQKLMYLGSRIKLEDLGEIKRRAEVSPAQAAPMSGDKRLGFISVDILTAVRNPDSVAIDRGGRNNLFYWLGLRLDEFQFDTDKKIEYINRAYNNLSDTVGFDLEEAYMAARLR